MNTEKLMFRFRMMFNYYSKICSYSSLRLSKESSSRYRITGVSEELCLFYALFHARLSVGISMSFVGDSLVVVCYAVTD